MKFTKNQSLILEIYFNHPEKTYYLRELGRLLGKEPGVFQKDINDLVKRKILISEFISNSRFFKLNKNYPLHKELKSIFFKTLGAEGKLKKILGTLENIEVAFIFGSYAKAREDSYSDIDVMIIGNPNEDLLINQISRLESQLDREINYHIFSPNDWRKTMIAKDSFLENIVSEPKIFLIGDKDELSKLY